MTLNNNDKDIQFKKGIKALQSISMTPREKGEVFHKLYNYTEARQPMAEKALLASLLKVTHAFRRIK
jgi:hypothetical protein